MIVPHMWGELIERRVAQYRYLRQKWKQNLELWTRSAAEIFDPSVSVRKTRLGTKRGAATVQARTRHREVTDEGDCGDGSGCGNGRGKAGGGGPAAGGGYTSVCLD